MAWWNQTSSASIVDRLRAARGGASGGFASDANRSTAQQTAQRASLWQRTQNVLNRRVAVPQSVANFLSHPIQSLVRATALPLLGGVGALGKSSFENVAQTIGKGASYSPLGKIFSGQINQGAKEFLGVAGTTAAVSDVMRNTYNYYTGKPINFLPTKGELAFSALAGFSPFGHVVGITGAGISNAARFVGRKTKDTFNLGKDKLAEPHNFGPLVNIPNPVPAVERYFSQGNFEMPSIPTIPVSVSLGGGGGGLGMEGLLLALGLGGGYLLGKRKRKKYKHRKSKKRHGRRQ